MTSSLRKRLGALLRSERGATAVEYGMILALIVLVAFVGINSGASVVVNMLAGVDHKVDEAM